MGHCAGGSATSDPASRCGAGCVRACHRNCRSTSQCVPPISRVCVSIGTCISLAIAPFLSFHRTRRRTLLRSRPSFRPVWCGCCTLMFRSSGLFLSGRPCPWLFPGNGARRPSGGFGQQISAFIAREAGLVMTPHQFRHLAAKLFLDQHPDGFETVRRLLGHKSLETTMRYYREFETVLASKRYAALLDGLLRAAFCPARTRSGVMIMPDDASGPSACRSSLASS